MNTLPTSCFCFGACLCFSVPNVQRLRMHTPEFLGLQVKLYRMSCRYDEMDKAHLLRTSGTLALPSRSCVPGGLFTKNIEVLKGAKRIDATIEATSV